MGHTSKSSFSSSTDWVNVNNLTQVFSGAVTTVAGSPAWYTITLDTSFTYNNTDNLLIAIDNNEGNYISSASQWYYTTKAANRFIYTQSDSTNSSPSSPPSGTVNAYSPNIILNIETLTATLTYAAGEHGSLTGSVSQTVTVGESGTAVTAVPDDGYYFVKWSDDETANPRTDSEVSGDISVTAIFALNSSLTDVRATATATSATIEWTSGASSTSQVLYGLTTDLSLQTTEDSSLVTSHSVELADLVACARYYYQVVSKDEYDTSSNSEVASFYTTGCNTSSVSGGGAGRVAVGGGSVSVNTQVGTARIEAPENFFLRSGSPVSGDFQINKLITAAAPTPPASRGIVADNFFELLAVATDDHQEISSFDQPVTFTVSYDEQIESDYDEATLDVYKYVNGEWQDKDCTLDTTANTLTCSLAGFSTYAVLGEALTEEDPDLDDDEDDEQEPADDSAQVIDESTAEQQSNSRSGSKAKICTDLPPGGAPHLFQIDRLAGAATLYFTPILGTADYFISYSDNSDAEKHSLQLNIEPLGVLSVTIDHLLPDQTYYFKVRGQNGCMPGEWSNIKSVAASIQNEESAELTVKKSLQDVASSQEDEQISESDALPSAAAGVVQETQAESKLHELAATKLPSISVPWGEMIGIVKKMLTDSIFLTGEKTQDISENIGYAIINLGYKFIDEPTEIYDVKVAIISPTQVKVSWKTNHPANGKVNYGLTPTYDEEIQSDKLVTEHEFVLQDLDPATTYHFEVMSHAKTYVYDANRQFVTPTTNSL